MIVGAGVAGLRAAIELAEAGEVLVVAKDSLRESSSEYAQGGIAVALSDDDEVELHEHDTLAAGDGLCDREAVRTLVEEGPAAIQQLMDWGAEFDRDGSRLLFAREGAHSRRRVLHAHGDSTGREISRTLFQKASTFDSIRFHSFSAVTDLLVNDGSVGGAVACDKSARRQITVHARALLLATGGLGRVYRETTNPDVATGDGVATAYRAGAEIADIEFVQFHPTALHLPGAPRFLLSEALRGEGAYLRDAAGERFMHRFHPMQELAPRDVVSRSILAQMRADAASHVWLDMTHLDPEFLRRRFPRIYETCLRHGLDLTREPTPVTPAAHYAMGGVRTQLDGRTNLERLYAAGEAACTGVHGANRLASNSLLEGLVFGARAGGAMREWAGTPIMDGRPPGDIVFPGMSESELRHLMWEQCGILRDEPALLDACERMENVARGECPGAGRAQHELRNMHTVAGLIARCALARQESRGAHYRTDFPEKSHQFQRHSRTTNANHEISFN